MNAAAAPLAIGTAVHVLNLRTGQPRPGVRYVVARTERGAYLLATRPTGKPGPVLWGREQIAPVA